MPVTRRRQKMASETTPLVSSPSPVESLPAPSAVAGTAVDASKPRMKVTWIGLAVASGACAAFNGVFAKLTTTELTTRIAESVANAIGLSKQGKAIEFIIRAAFFGLNLLFNGVMWGLFTAALAKGTSSTKVSIINTSSNFMLTALLGFAIFSEALPPLWWVGAAFLVAGNVVIGRREEAPEGAVALPVTTEDIEIPEEQALLDEDELRD